MTGPVTLPVTWQDQAILDLEGDADPWNIQLEMSCRASVDLERLHEAVHVACRRHPLLRARLRAGGPFASRSAWDVSTLHDVPVLERVLDGSEDLASDLAALRTDLHSPAFDLRVEGPLRVRVVRRRGAVDLVCFTAAHPVVDGVGLLRFVRSVSAAYRGEDDPADAVDLPTARRLSRLLRPASLSEAVRRAGEGGAKLMGAVRAPSRVSRDSEDTRHTSGFAHRRVEGDVVDRVKRCLPADATLNDLLLASTMHAVEAWNDHHGDTTDKVQLFMPANVRPKAWASDMAMNLVSYVSVATRSIERGSLARTVEVVSARTRSTSRTRPSLGTQDLLRLVAPVPLTVKRLLPRLLAVTGFRFVDTAVVSNLGRPDDLLSLDGDEPTEVYFTPPYWSAASISVGAISSGGSLHLGLRHRLSDLDRTAGESLMQLVTDFFTSMSTSGAD